MTLEERKINSGLPLPRGIVRIMTAARAHRLILNVRDPGALATWYGLVFGWQVSLDERDEGWIELEAGGFVLALHTGPPRDTQEWPKLQIVVGEVEAVRERLIAHGVAMDAVQHWKHLSWSEGRDPEGNVFQISRS